MMTKQQEDEFAEYNKDIEVGFLITTPQNESFKIVELTSFDCGDCAVWPTTYQDICRFIHNCKHRPDGRFLCWKRATKQEVEEYNNRYRKLWNKKNLKTQQK